MPWSKFPIVLSYPHYPQVGYHRLSASWGGEPLSSRTVHLSRRKWPGGLVNQDSGQLSKDGVSQALGIFGGGATLVEYSGEVAQHYPVLSVLLLQGAGFRVQRAG